VRGSFLTGLYLISAVMLGSLFAWATHGWLPFEYEKVLSRSILIFAALGLVPLWRLLGLTPAGIGLDGFSSREWLGAFGLGLLLIGPVVLFFWVVEYRVLIPDAQFARTNLFAVMAVGVVSSILVALFEETLFRGVLYTALDRRWGNVGAVLVSSFAYAIVHFIEVDPASVTVSWHAGFVYLFASLNGLAEPSSYWDSFVSLFLLGVFLCYVRNRSSLWWCIGLWVFAIRIQSAITDRDIENPFLFAVGDYDNFTGHLVSVWLLFLLLVLNLRDRIRESR